MNLGLCSAFLNQYTHVVSILMDLISLKQDNQIQECTVCGLWNRLLLHAAQYKHRLSIKPTLFHLFVCDACSQGMDNLKV